MTFGPLSRAGRHLGRDRDQLEPKTQPDNPREQPLDQPLVDRTLLASTGKGCSVTAEG